MKMALNREEWRSLLKKARANTGLSSQWWGWWNSRSYWFVSGERATWFVLQKFEAIVCFVCHINFSLLLPVELCFLFVVSNCCYSSLRSICVIEKCRLAFQQVYINVYVTSAILIVSRSLMMKFGMVWLYWQRGPREAYDPNWLILSFLIQILTPGVANEILIK
jgi:hypothetical protein